MTDVEMREGLCVGELVVVSKQGLEKLQSEVAELLKDKARLDWLESHSLISPIKCVFGKTSADGKSIGQRWTRYGTEAYQDHYDTLREAIDAQGAL